MTTAATVMTYFLVVFFAFGCCIKLLSIPRKMVDFQMGFFELYGLTRVHMYLVGLLELFGVVSMFWYLLVGSALMALLGAGAIFIASVGALYFHFRYDEAKYAMPAVVTFLMSAVIMIDAYPKV